MILLDPDLGPAPSRPTSQAAEAHDRLPSARALARFLKTAQEAVRLRGMVSVLLTTDRSIRQLNKTFRGKNKATDVLSFPAAEQARRDVAGDLAISVETARKQAREHGHALAIEIKVLMLHGLLHLAGYDHETDDGQMARREQALRQKLGLPSGLIERTAATPAPAPRLPAPRVQRAQSARAAEKSRKSGAPASTRNAGKRAKPAQKTKAGPPARATAARRGRTA